MPIFEFACKDCRNTFKTLRRANQLDDVNCPECGKGRVSRLLSVTASTPTGTGTLGGEACAMPAMGGG